MGTIPTEGEDELGTEKEEILLRCLDLLVDQVLDANAETDDQEPEADTFKSDANNPKPNPEKSQNESPETIKKKSILNSDNSTAEPSVVHAGDNDSSEDEYFNEYKPSLSSTGKEYSSLLKDKRKDSLKDVDVETYPVILKPLISGPIVLPEFDKNELLCDPILKMNIKHPKISVNSITALRKTYNVIPIGDLKGKKCLENWITGGVITASVTRCGKTGKNYTIWNITDLKGDIKSIKVLVFGLASITFESLGVGNIVALINARVCAPEERVEATLSVINPQQVVVLGESKDFALCGHKTLSGHTCKAPVNLSVCRYCVHHARKVHHTSKLEDFKSKVTKGWVPNPGHASSRSSTATLKRPIVDTWAGPSSAPKKMKMSDMAGFQQTYHKNVKRQDVRVKDSALLAKLDKKSTQGEALPGGDVPQLTCDKNNMVSLGPVGKRRSTANVKAIELVRNGLDVKQKPARKLVVPELKKVQSNQLPTSNLSPLEQKKLRMGLTQDFYDCLTASSSNPELGKRVEKEELEKQFDKGIKTEEVVEKLAQTKSISTQAWKCKTCTKVTLAFPNECRNKEHQIYRTQTIKRFFECRECRSAENFLTVRPNGKCRKCGACSWQSVGMVKPKIVNAMPDLSIRGMEQKFVNSDGVKLNINLLVPDQGA